MSNRVNITITTDLAEGTLASSFSDASPNVSIAKMASFLRGMMGGQYAASISTSLNEGNSAYATGTLTCTSVASTNTAVINGTTITAVDKRETTQVTCVADVADSLNSKYFTFFSALDATKYYVWYDTGTGVDPAVAAATGIHVVIATGATASAVALATRTAIPLIAGADVTISGATDKVIIQNKAVGATTNAANGGASPGFSYSVTVPGGSVGAAEFQIGTDAVTASNLNDKVNTLLTSVATSTVNSAIVTVTAASKGTGGNFITISGTGGVAAGAARLSGGTATSNSVTLNFGV